MNGGKTFMIEKMAQHLICRACIAAIAYIPPDGNHLPAPEG